MNWIALLNLILPAAANLVLLIQNESGTTTAIISSTETATDATIAQLQTWLQQHQAQAPAPVAATPAPAPVPIA